MLNGFMLRFDQQRKLFFRSYHWGKNLYTDEYSYNAGGVILENGELVDDKNCFSVIEPILTILKAIWIYY